MKMSKTDNSCVCLTFSWHQVPGKMNLRGSNLQRLQSLNRTHEDQHLPGERRNVTYISRLQAMQAAVDHQLNELVKSFPHRRVALISFNNEVCVTQILH